MPIAMDPLLLRFIERITTVLTGAFSIYLGYRLFLSMPEQKTSDGKFVLPLNTSIVLTKVGPGIFFALFGIAAVIFALSRPMQMQGGRVASYAAPGSLTNQDERTDARALLRKDMAVLNTIPKLLRPGLNSEDRLDVELGLHRIKLGLMHPVWGTSNEGFGDFSVFEKWVQAGEPGAAPQGMDGALSLYRYGEAP
jgi:hypothetical protein